MTITVKDTSLVGVKLIEVDQPFHDHRGYFIETYNQQIYIENEIKIKFIQDDISVSKKNVLRGIHGDEETWKLVSCLSGNIFFVVVNNDTSSPQYRKWQGFSLSDEKYQQVLIPPKFGNGHQVLSDIAIFHYKQSTYYNPSGQFTIKWNDKNLSIKWPHQNPILSKRDEQGFYENDKI